MSNKPENKNGKDADAKKGDANRKDEVMKAINKLLKENKLDEIKDLLSGIEDDQKVENELTDGGFLKIATLHDLNEAKKIAELSVLQKTDKIRQIEDKIKSECPNIQKTLYKKSEDKKELGTACVTQGKANKNKVLISLASGTLDLNTLVKLVHNYSGNDNMGNKEFRSARSSMYNNILEYLNSIGLVGRSPKNTSPKMAWLTSKGLKAVEKIKTNLENELKD